LLSASANAAQVAADQSGLRAQPAGPVWLDAVVSLRCRGRHSFIKNIADNAYSTGGRGQFLINSLCTTATVIPAQAGIQQPLSSCQRGAGDADVQNVSKLSSVADLGSDPNSAPQLRIDYGRIPELGYDPNSAGHRARHALSGQPAIQTRRAVTSYRGTRNRPPPAVPVWLDAVVSTRCQGCHKVSKNIAGSACTAWSGGQFLINFPCTTQPIISASFVVKPVRAGIQRARHFNLCGVVALDVQNVSNAPAVADLGSDSYSATLHQIRYGRIPELGADPNSAGYRARLAGRVSWPSVPWSGNARHVQPRLFAQPARLAQRAAASYWGIRNRRPSAGPVWLDVVALTRCRGCHKGIKNIAGRAYSTWVRGQFLISSLCTIATVIPATCLATPATCSVIPATPFAIPATRFVIPATLFAISATRSVIPAQAGIQQPLSSSQRGGADLDVQNVSNPPAVSALNSSNPRKPAAVAELGSDPNSAQQHQASKQRLTELGSDPNSAGHRHTFISRCPARLPSAASTTPRDHAKINAAKQRQKQPNRQANAQRERLHHAFALFRIVVVEQQGQRAEQADQNHDQRRHNQYLCQHACLSSEF